MQLPASGWRSWLRSALRILTLVALIAGGVPAVFFAFLSSMPGSSYTGAMPALSRQEQAIADRLRVHVQTLAGEIGERNLSHRDAYARAESYLIDELRAAGYGLQTEDVPAGRWVFHNLIVEIPGATDADCWVVVGAHYDSPLGSPGADDNASGTAGLVEIARLLADASPGCSLRFVFFANEEPPFFGSEQMGSRVHARGAAARNESIRAMLSLEMLGFYSDEAGSQRYPPLLDYFYPDRGEFIAFVGNLASRELIAHAIASFRKSARFPSEGLTAPAWIRGSDYSDHQSFEKEGYPALMVTDTAFLRNANYHQPGDTPDTLDYERMARLVLSLRDLINHLASTQCLKGGVRSPT